jgi:polysaccharide pyruvyl transferase
MKITFITTIDYNVGDDFVREGLKYLIKQVLINKEIDFQNIHKHSPITVRDGFEWFKNLKFSKFTFPSQSLDKILPLGITRDKILDTDLLVQSGAPVYWCHTEIGSHCSDNEWYDTLIRRRYKRNRKAKLINMGAGTCQSYNSDGSEFLKCENDINYIKEFYNLASLTTVRDKLAKKVLTNLGLEPTLLPCPSIFAIDEYKLAPQEKKYVIINFMNLGGHFSFGSKIESESWYEELLKVYNELKDKEEILFVCHNKNEVDDAKKIDKDAQIFFSKNYLDYMKIYGQGKFGIMNRVHGAFLMASYGTPSVIIGNDSRARMSEEIGLDNVFVNDATAQFILNKYYEHLNAPDRFEELFKQIKENSFNHYIKVLSETLVK